MGLFVMSWNWWVLFRYLSHRGHEMSSTNQGQRYWFHMQRVILMNAYIYFCQSLWHKVSWLNSDITSAKCKVVWFETASIYFLRLSNKTWDVIDTFHSSDASMTYLYNIPSLHKYKCFSSVCTDLNPTVTCCRDWFIYITIISLSLSFSVYRP